MKQAAMAVRRFGVASVAGLDVRDLAIWAWRRTLLALGCVLFVIGLILAPTPIPLGLPLIALSLIIILNTSTTAKKMFVRWRRRYPITGSRLRNMLGRRRRTQHRSKTTP